MVSQYVGGKAIMQRAEKQKASKSAKKAPAGVGGSKTKIAVKKKKKVVMK